MSKTNIFALMPFSAKYRNNANAKFPLPPPISSIFISLPCGIFFNTLSYFAKRVTAEFRSNSSNLFFWYSFISFFQAGQLRRLFYFSRLSSL